MNVNYKCDKCGESPKEDKDKSNENWKVISLNCDCGGRMKMGKGL